MNSSDLLIESLKDVLQQGTLLLRSLDDDSYTQKVTVAYDSSIGGHYRHCLDHFQNLFSALEKSDLNYDQRNRDPRLEVDRSLALKLTQDFLLMAKRLMPAGLAHPLTIHSKVGYQAQGTPSVSSTVGREVMYCVAHAVHHYALIGVMCGLQGVNLPEGFGVAPSTLKHRQEELLLQPAAA